MAPTKLQPRGATRNDDVLDGLDEALLVTSVGGALADAASEHRVSIEEDPRTAARRAAVEIATAALIANSAETAAHSDDVDLIAEAIGRKLGLSEQQLDDVMVAARLHDIGKLGVPSRILNKPAALTPDEWQVIHRHTIIGEQILLAVPELRSAARLVRHSHERWDGGGYPDGLAADEIPLGSRIVFCADAFHAIRSTRAYRMGRSAGEAIAEIRACAGTQFDPAVVDALVETSRELRIGTNGGRPRSRRAGRLMALMLVVSVGACGSAFARSGLMPEAKPAPREPHGSAAGTAAPAGAPAPVAGRLFSTPAGAAGAAAAGGGAPASPNSTARHAVLFTAGPLALFGPSAALPGSSLTPFSPAPPAVTAPAATVAAPSSSSGSSSGSGPSSDNGVRDQGTGTGQGKSKGVAHGKATAPGQVKKQAGATTTTAGGNAATGNGGGKTASNGTGNAKAPGQANKQASDGTTSTSGSGDSKSGKANGQEKASKTGGGSTSKGGGGSTGTSPGGSGSVGSPKTPKSPKPPKPPKTSPVPAGSADSSSGASSGSGASGSGSSSSSTGNVGNGNGNGGGHGNGHGHGNGQG